MEIWKDINGYEGLYQVSNLGRVKSVERYIKHNIYNTNKVIKERTLKPINNGTGYQMVNLSKNNQKQQQLIHRLVASAFIPNPNNLPQVNHINENKTDNRIENLEWCDAKYNINYGTARKRMIKKTSKPIYSVNITTHEIEYYQSASDAYRKTKIDRGDICNCCRGKYNSAGGYKWYYA